MIDVKSYQVATRQKESVLRVKMKKLSAAPEIEISKINHKNVQNQLQTPLISDSIQTMDTSVSFPKLEVTIFLLLRNNYVMNSDHGHENSQFDVFDHPDVQFIMIMRRYPLFYNAFLITPCLLISFLTALVYYLPCASHQKITFCTSVLLGKFS